MALYREIIEVNGQFSIAILCYFRLPEGNRNPKLDLFGYFGSKKTSRIHMAPANLMVENSVLGNIFVEFIRGFPALGTSI